jgi:serine/threonine-protein kinase
MFAPAAVGNVVAGKYRVERILGQGGMGIVVAARHLRLGERVAIKFPLAQMRDRSDVVARLMREGRAAMRIRSEHVARVYDVGVLETGEPFLVMECLTGRDLGARVADGGPLPFGEAVEYILQSLEALAEAHACGIVHRDVKPSNLFLTHRADGSPMVKVIDFGISKITNLDGEATLTETAAVLGSRPYMAPEQMRSGAAIDARSDIWSLGATLHALLTGKPPFLGGSMVDIHERILLGPPRLRSSLPDAPDALEAILLRCMRRDPAERYADVAELAAALAEVAPPHARISALRAARVLSQADRVREAGDDSPAGSGIEGVTDFTSSMEGPRETDQQLMASWRDTRLATAIEPGQSGTVPPASTTPTSRAAPPGRRAGRFGLATILAGGAILALFGFLRSQPRSLRAAAAESGTPPVAVAVPARAQRSATPTVDAPASLLAAPPVSPAASAPPARGAGTLALTARRPSTRRARPVPPTAPAAGAPRSPASDPATDLLADPD